jgi:hypothetical protein
MCCHVLRLVGRVPGLVVCPVGLSLVRSVVDKWVGCLVCGLVDGLLGWLVFGMVVWLVGSNLEEMMMAQPWPIYPCKETL